MAKVGRPPKYDADFHPASLLELCDDENIHSKAHICREWGINRSTLYQWVKDHKEFSNALKDAMDIMEAKYIDLGMDLAKGKQSGNVAAWIWLTKNVLGYSDKVETTNRVSIDGISFSDDDDDEPE